jgi:hypothetical protein
MQNAKIAALTAAVLLLSAPLAGSSYAENADPSLPGGTYQSIKQLPDFSGVWEPINPLNPADEYRQKYPLTQKAAAAYADLAHKIAAHQPIKSRTITIPGAAIPCQQRGFPGGMFDKNTLLEFEFTPGRVTIDDTSGWVRRIYTDGRKHLDFVESFQGDAIAHWEGNALVVDTDYLDGNNELVPGLKIGAKTHVVERYSLSDPNTMNVDMTIEAPIFTQPYKTTLKFKRHADWQINEYDCYFNNRDNNHKIVR